MLKDLSKITFLVLFLSMRNFKQTGLCKSYGCQQKQKKSIDQRAPQIGYEGIKSLQPPAMKNYLVTEGLLSLVESYNNNIYAKIIINLADKLVAV